MDAAAALEAKEIKMTDFLLTTVDETAMLGAVHRLLAVCRAARGPRGPVAMDNGTSGE